MFSVSALHLFEGIRVFGDQMESEEEDVDPGGFTVKEAIFQHHGKWQPASQTPSRKTDEWGVHAIEEPVEGRPRSWAIVDPLGEKMLSETM